MRFAVMGTGGIGGCFGARLADAGEDVAFIARAAHLEAIRRDGLAVLSERGNVHIQPAQATDDPSEIGPVDAVLFTVKLWDTETAGRACRPLLGPDTPVLTLQNGVEAPGMLAAILGVGHVMAGATYMPAAIERPGVIRHSGTVADIVFGELDGRKTPRTEALLAAFTGAGIDASLVDDVEAVLWRKFVFLVATSGVASTTRRTFAELRGDPVARGMFRDCMAEALNVGRASGVDLPDDLVEDGMARLDAMPEGATASMARDLERGNRLELDWCAGAIVRLGRQHGVPTPVNSAILERLRPFAAGR